MIVVKDLGDAIFLESLIGPSEAIAAAQIVQRKMHERWPNLPIRCIIHCGEVVHTEAEDLFGKHIIQLFRSEKVSAANEIVLSEAARTALAGSDHIFQGKGPYRIRNFGSPIKFYKIVQPQESAQRNAELRKVFYHDSEASMQTKSLYVRLAILQVLYDASTALSAQSIEKRIGVKLGTRELGDALSSMHQLVDHEQNSEKYSLREQARIKMRESHDLSGSKRQLVFETIRGIIESTLGIRLSELQVATVQQHVSRQIVAMFSEVQNQMNLLLHIENSEYRSEGDEATRRRGDDKTRRRAP